jgi:hypothetical protein
MRIAICEVVWINSNIIMYSEDVEQKLFSEKK